MDIEKFLGLKKNNAEDESVPELLARPSDDTPGLAPDKDAAVKAFIEKYKQQAPVQELADGEDVQMEQDQIADPSKRIDASQYLDLVKQSAHPQQMAAQSEIQQAPKQDAVDYLKLLKEAQAQDRQKQFGADLGKAATLIGHSIAGLTPSKEVLEGFTPGKSAVTELHSQVEMDQQAKNIALKESMRDPNSDVSRKVRDLLSQAGIKDIPETVSAEQLDKMGLNVSNLLTQQKAQDLKRELADVKAESQKELAALKGGKKDNDSIVKALKEMDEMKASSRSGIGREVNRLNAGNHVLGILAHYDDLNKVPENIKREAAVGLATMVSPGLPHEATIAAMDPKTFQQTLSGYLSYITGQPYGAGAAGNLKLIKDSLSNQMNISRDLLKKNQNQFLEGYKATMPSNAYDKLESIIKSKDLYTKSEQLSDEDQKAVDWAKSNKDDPRAQQILKLHGL